LALFVPFNAINADLPLDTCPRQVKIIRISGMQTPCEHKKTVIIARRDGVDYMECLDCKQIFEAEDLEPVAVEADEE
jgi:hypothetical protein